MKYFVGLLIAIGLVVLVVIMIIRGFSGGSTTKNQTPLSDYATTNTVMQMTVEGPIVTDQEHQGYRVSVGRDQVVVEAFQGYQYSVIASKTYSNNQDSYNNFLRAIDIAGFAKGNSKSPATDPRGVCATGDRVTFKILNGSSEVQNYWGTSCGGQGNFKGNFTQVKQLFNRQIPTPDYSIVGRLHL